MVDCVAFDFDGTLVQSNQIKRQAFLDIAEELDFGGARMSRLLDDNTDKDRFGIFKLLTQALGGGDAAQLADRYSEICEREILAAPYVPGALEALDRLGPRNLYLNSATPTRALERLALGLGIANRFSGIYGSEASKLCNLETIRSRENIQPSMMVMVGDNDADMNAAVTFGCPFVGIGDRGGFSENPEFLLPDLFPLADLLGSLN